MKKLKVVLNARSLSVMELIHKARTTVQNVSDHPTVFINPNPALATMTLATDELEAAAIDASDGGKSKTALRNDKQRKLIDLLLLFAVYIEQTAAGDAEIVHLSGFSLKKDPSIASHPDFLVQQGDYEGKVIVKVKPRKEKTLYKWEHSSDAATWISDGVTTIAKSTINGLVKGVYWFRVVMIDSSGEHEQARVSFAVN